VTKLPWELTTGELVWSVILGVAISALLIGAFLAVAFAKVSRWSMDGDR